MMEFLRNNWRKSGDIQSSVWGDISLRYNCGMLHEDRSDFDLSHPSDSSVNDSIPSQLYRLTYVTIDDAILNIFKSGRNIILAKVNIKNAFCLLPVHLSDQYLASVVNYPIHFNLRLNLSQHLLHKHPVCIVVI